MVELPLYFARDLAHLDFATVTGCPRTVHLDLGTGLGHFPVEMALKDPTSFWIAVEQEGPVARRAARRVRSAGLSNVVVFCADARPLLFEWIPEESLDHIWINFPDPWPKDRHADRRHTHPWMLQLLAASLRPTGGLHLATDVSAYAEALETALAERPEWRSGHAIRRAELGITTKYERKWLAQGRPPHYGDWTRTDAPAAGPWPTGTPRCDAPRLPREGLPLPPGVTRCGDHLLKIFPERDGRQHGVLIDRRLGYDQHCVIDVSSGAVDLGGVWTPWKAELLAAAHPLLRHQISTNSATSVTT